MGCWQIAAFGKHSVVVHVIFQFSLEQNDFASETSSAIIRAAMTGALASELQAKDVKVVRITLAEDPLVTFKNVFAGMEDTMAPEVHNLPDQANDSKDPIFEFDNCSGCEPQGPVHSPGFKGTSPIRDDHHVWVMFPVGNTVWA